MAIQKTLPPIESNDDPATAEAARVAEAAKARSEDAEARREQVDALERAQPALARSDLGDAIDALEEAECIGGDEEVDIAAVADRLRAAHVEIEMAERDLSEVISNLEIAGDDEDGGDDEADESDGDGDDEASDDENGDESANDE